MIISTLLESIQYGARGIERHICFGSDDKFDVVSASDFLQFEAIYNFFKNKTIQRNDFKYSNQEQIPLMSDSEIKDRKSMLKVVLNKNLNKGDILSKDDFILKSCSVDNYLFITKMLELMQK